MEQTRRQFFRSMIGGVAAAAAVRSWPFRVYSFPAEIERPCWTIHSTHELMLREGDLITIQETILRAELPELFGSADRLYRVLKTKGTVLEVAPMPMPVPIVFHNLSRSSQPRSAGVT